MKKNKNKKKNTSLPKPMLKTEKKVTDDKQQEKTVKADFSKADSVQKTAQAQQSLKAEKTLEDNNISKVEEAVEGKPKTKKTRFFKEKIKKEKSALEPVSYGKEFKERIFSVNPVFVKFIAAIPILGAAVTLKNGILISAVMLLTVVILNVVMYPLANVIPRHYRHLAEFVIAGIIVTPQLFAASIFIPTVTEFCEFYLPLTAVCATAMVETKYYGMKYGFGRTVLIGALNACGFVFAALTFSMLREIVGKGFLYERPMPYSSNIKLPIATLPAGALILLGFIAALFRKIFGTNEQNGEK